MASSVLQTTSDQGAPVLVLSSSSYPQEPESLLSSSSPQTHDLHKLNQIALNLVNLPPNYYSEAILALPSTDTSPDYDPSYTELENALPQILATMNAGGHIRIGNPPPQFKKEALLAGFLLETQNNQTILVKPIATKAIPLPFNPRKRTLEVKIENPWGFEMGNVSEVEECETSAGKRRKACKDCTCGLKEIEDAEKLSNVVLREEELEVMVQG